MMNTIQVHEVPPSFDQTNSEFIILNCAVFDKFLLFHQQPRYVHPDYSSPTTINTANTEISDIEIIFLHSTLLSLYSFPSGHSMNAASLYGGGAIRKELPRVLRVSLLYKHFMCPLFFHGLSNDVSIPCEYHGIGCMGIFAKKAVPLYGTGRTA